MEMGPSQNVTNADVANGLQPFKHFIDIDQMAWLTFMLSIDLTCQMYFITTMEMALLLTWQQTGELTWPFSDEFIFRGL